MAVQFNFPGQQRMNANGQPLAGAMLYFYEPESTTPKDVFSDEERQTPIAQPVVADAAGVWPRIFCDGKYKVVLHDANDVLIDNWDDFDPGLSAGLGIDEAIPVSLGGTGATTPASARTNLGAASQAQVTNIQSSITVIQNAIEPGLNAEDQLGTAAAHDIGTSGENLGLLNASKTDEGDNVFSGENEFSNSAGILSRNTAKAYAYYTVATNTINYNAATQGFNIASITRDNEGLHDFTFETALPTNNYVVLAVGGDAQGGATGPVVGFATNKTTNGFRLNIYEMDDAPSLNDGNTMNVVVFGY